MNKPSSKALTQLKKALAGCVYTDEPSLFTASFDGMKRSFMPQARVVVQEEEQVGQLLRLANRYAVPVTTRGSGSALTGAATPWAGGWVLDLSRLKKFRIDVTNRLCHSYAGAVVGKVQAAVQKKGLYYPPDPSSVQWCTIGGNIACNAGGLHCVKYGVTRDYVVALKGFLPTGEFVEWGRPIRKFATAYNMRDLWIGQEGTLGVVTQASLRLIPKPAARWTLLNIFDNESKALQAVLALMKSGVQPAVCEFLDCLSVTGAERATGKALFPGQSGKAVVLLEIDGHPAVLREEKKLCLAWAKQWALAHKSASSEEKIEALWQVRRKCSSAMFELGNSKLNEDICVPLHQQARLMRFILGLRKKSGLAIATFGHAGDGNLHVNVMYNREDKTQCVAAEQTVDALMQEVVRLGGAISGEHGVGLAKTPFLAYQYQKHEIEVMQKIKKQLDPNNILNPGKIFNHFEMWKHEPVKYRLPWDHR